MRGIWLKFFSAALATTLLFSSCEEIGPTIDLTGKTTVDTTYVATQIEAPQQKNVLLEEFTGVKCINCPAGHELIENLKGQYGQRLLVVSAHSDFLASPYDGDPDLRNEDAEDLENLLGPLLAKPSAAIDRVLFSGESSKLVLTQKWASFVDQQINSTTPVNIHIETSFKSNGRDLDAVVTIHYTEEESAENKLTVMLLEDNIVTLQLDHPGIDSNYVQNRVLRKILTSVNGLTITATREQGRVVVTSFQEEGLPSDWKENDMRVVALVHRSGSSVQVLQAVEKSIL